MSAAWDIELQESRDRRSSGFAAPSGSAAFSVLDLFSGIGGFALATEWAGGRTIAFCEIAEYQSNVLAARWPDVPNLKDAANDVGVWLRANDKVSYHADNAGGAHGKATNDK